MTTTQLVGVLTLVGTLLVAGMALGRANQQLADVMRRVEKIEHAQDTADSERNYLHGKIDLP